MPVSITQNAPNRPLALMCILPTEGRSKTVRVYVCVWPQQLGQKSILSKVAEEIKCKLAK